MSPEQANDQPIDARADLYACGVVFYRMIAGALPFSADTPLGLMLSHIEERPRRLSEYLPSAGAELERIVARALAKDKVARYQNAVEMRSELARYLDRQKKQEAGKTGSAQDPGSNSSPLPGLLFILPDEPRDQTTRELRPPAFDERTTERMEPIPAPPPAKKGLPPWIIAVGLLLIALVAVIATLLR
jgi:serine/threonine protein kinase